MYRWVRRHYQFQLRGRRFLEAPWSGGLVLLISVAVAMLLANLPLTADGYQRLLNIDIALVVRGSGGMIDWMFPRGLTLQTFVNDGLMVVFFFLIGLEIKREIVVGQLSSVKKAILPVLAALGGMVVPALIYFSFNAGTVAAPGWGIPTATDIAFAIGILSIFSDRVPISLKIFLTALAVADDLGAILVIALFYGEEVNLLLLAIAILILIGIYFLNKVGETRIMFYLVPAFVVWALFYYSGIHSTLSGVVIAMFIPMKPRYSKEYFARKMSGLSDSLLKAEYDRRVAGHPFTKGSDCNMLCYDYFYGLDMPLLAMEVMNNGLSGVAAWMLDDAMHSNGDSGRTEDVKIWGMWNILGEEVFGDASQEELRPWYYTWSLMCRHFPAGCDILACEVPQREGLRVAAARKDAAYSVAAVNFSQEPCTLEIVLPGDFAGGVLYRYTESDRACDANGFPAPCERGIAGKRFRTTVPAESFVLLTNVE